MFSIYMHFLPKHYMTHYISSTSKSEQVFSGLLPQIWLKYWSHWEKCNYHNRVLLPRCLCQNILPKLKLFSVLVRQDIFERACHVMFVMSQQLPSDICSISNSKIIFGILSVSYRIFCRLNTSTDILTMSQRAHLLIIELMENFLVILFFSKWMAVCLDDVKWFTMMLSFSAILNVFSSIPLNGDRFSSMLLNSYCFYEKQTAR